MKKSRKKKVHAKGYVQYGLFNNDKPLTLCCRIASGREVTSDNDEVACKICNRRAMASR